MPNPLQKFSKSRQKGNVGEDIACLFLMKQGFEIVERNHLKPWGEIDIVAKKSETLHFFEVKSVSCLSAIILGKAGEIQQNNVSRETVTHETINPEENAHLSKLHRFSRVIQTYLSEKRVSQETPYQADLITVRFDTNTKKAVVERFEKIL